MKKKAIYHNLFGSISNFAFLFITSIILLPYYFKFINEFEYGIWLGGISFLSLLAVLEANISLILTQKLGSKWVSNEPLEFSRYLSSAIFIGILISIMIVAFALFAKGDLYRWVSKKEVIDPIFTYSFLIYSVSIAVTIVSGFFNSITQVFLRTFWTPVFNLVGSIAGIVVTIIYIPKYGVLALALGNLIKGLINGVLVIIYAVKLLKEKNIHFSFQLNYANEFIKNIRLPFVSKMGMTTATTLQNFIVASSVSASATTVFDITRKLPIITVMLLNMIAVSSFTSFSLYYSESQEKNEKHAYTNYYFSTMKVILLIGVFIVFLFGKDFTLVWVGSDKFGGDTLLAMICLVAIGDLLRQMLSQQYYAIGNFKLTSTTEIIFAISFIIGAFFLIPVFELYGIVLASILANIFYFIICYFLEKNSKISMVSSIVNFSLVKDVVFLLFLAIICKGLIIYLGLSLIGSFLIAFFFIGIVLLYFYSNNKPLFNFIKAQVLNSIKVR